MSEYEFIKDYIENNRAKFEEMSDKIWEYAEPRFQEYKSSKLQQDFMEKEGFKITSNLAGEETAFIAEYGQGKPVIAFLGEFDSLSGLSQEADCTEKKPVCEGG